MKAPNMTFALHHFTLSVRDIDRSVEFYRIFGFRHALRWTAPDGSLEIEHLVNGDGFIIELFQYRENSSRPSLELDTGNNLPDIGVKHVAFKVLDLAAAHADFKMVDNADTTEITEGRTGITYFFVSDPDGNWVEIVQDERSLTPEP
jgi:glyoxylase I family protein